MVEGWHLLNQLYWIEWMISHMGIPFSQTTTRVPMWTVSWKAWNSNRRSEAKIQWIVCCVIMQKYQSLSVHMFRGTVVSMYLGGWTIQYWRHVVHVLITSRCCGGMSRPDRKPGTLGLRGRSPLILQDGGVGMVCSMALTDFSGALLSGIVTSAVDAFLWSAAGQLVPWYWGSSIRKEPLTKGTTPESPVLNWWSGILQTSLSSNVNSILVPQLLSRQYLARQKSRASLRRMKFILRTLLKDGCMSPINWRREGFPLNLPDNWLTEQLIFCRALEFHWVQSRFRDLLRSWAYTRQLMAMWCT